MAIFNSYVKLPEGSPWFSLSIFIHMRIMRFYHMSLLVHHIISIKLLFWSYAALSTHPNCMGVPYLHYIPSISHYIRSISPLYYVGLYDFFLFVLILSICDCFAWWHGLLRTPGVKTEDKSCPSYFWQPLKCPPNMYIYICLLYIPIASLLYMDVSLKWGHPQIIHFRLGLSIINHPAIGYPHWWKPPRISSTSPVKKNILYFEWSNLTTLTWQVGKKTYHLWFVHVFTTIVAKIFPSCPRSRRNIIHPGRFSELCWGSLLGQAACARGGPPSVRGSVVAFCLEPQKKPKMGKGIRNITNYGVT